MGSETLQIVNEGSKLLSSDRKVRRSHINFAILLSLLLLVVISAYLLISSFFAYPAIDGDAKTYFPPITAFASGRGLINPVMSESMYYDPTGGNRFVFHGYLFQILIGAIAWGKDAAAIFTSARLLIAAIISLNAAFSLFMFCHVTRSTQVSKWKRAAYVSAALLGVMSALDYDPGRPEPYATFLVMSGACLMIITQWQFHWIIGGCFIGLLMATHPIACYLSFLLLSACMTTYYEWKSCLFVIARIILLSILTFASTLLIYPHTLTEWLSGCLRQMKDLALSESFSPLQHLQIFAHEWFISADGPFLYGLTFLGLGGYACIKLYPRLRENIRWNLGFYFFLFLMAASFYAIGIRMPWRRYNALVFSPFVFASILYACNSTSQRDNLLPKGGPRKYQFVFPVVLSCFLLASVYFLREVTLFPVYLKHGLSFKNAREQFATALVRCGQMQVDTVLFPLTESYNQVTFESSLLEEPVDIPCIAKQQAYRGASQPPIIPGFKLVHDGFSKFVPKILGFEIASSPRGYNFAVYKNRTRDGAQERRLNRPIRRELVKSPEGWQNRKNLFFDSLLDFLARFNKSGKIN